MSGDDMDQTTEVDPETMAKIRAEMIGGDRAVEQKPTVARAPLPVEPQPTSARVAAPVPISERTSAQPIAISPPRIEPSTVPPQARVTIAAPEMDPAGHWPLPTQAATPVVRTGQRLPRGWQWVLATVLLANAVVVLLGMLLLGWGRPGNDQIVEEPGVVEIDDGAGAGGSDG